MMFILGGRGFVGSAFARACASGGLEHRVIDLDNYAACIGGACDILVNANGNSSKPLAAREPLREFDASVRSVRASLADFRFNTYIHLSSCDVYPDCSGPDTTREDAPIDPARQSPYGFHKWLAERCVMHAAKNWIILRMGGFVGPGLKKNAIYDILHTDNLWLKPESQLQYMPTDDLARTALALAKEQAFGQVFNVCGSGLVRLADALRWAGRELAVDKNAPLVRYEVGIEKVEKLLPMPKTTDSVRRFIEAECGAHSR